MSAAYKLIPNFEMYSEDTIRDIKLDCERLLNRRWQDRASQYVRSHEDEVGAVNQNFEFEGRTAYNPLWQPEPEENGSEVPADVLRAWQEEK